VRNLIRALRGKPVELSEGQQAKMAKMQARADAMIAEQNAKGRRDERPQLGPYCGTVPE
jgi:hypothetical protein